MKREKQLAAWLVEDINRNTEDQISAFSAGWDLLREVVRLHDAYPDLSAFKYQDGFRILRELLNDSTN